MKIHNYLAIICGNIIQKQTSQILRTLQPNNKMLAMTTHQNWKPHYLGMYAVVEVPNNPHSRLTPSKVIEPLSKCAVIKYFAN